MPGRHAAAPSRGARRRVSAHGDRTRRAAAVVAATVALFAVAGWSAIASFSGGSRCESGRHLTLAASPDVAPVVQWVVSPSDGKALETDDGCEVTVQWSDPDEVLAAIHAGEHAPDLWIPDTSAWLERLPPALRDRQARPIATTPVVLVGPPGVRRPATWLAALSQPDARMLDPNASGVSVGALTAMQAEAVNGPAGDTALSRWLVATAKSAPEHSYSDEDLLNNAANGGEVGGGWFPTTEQRFADAVEEAPAGGRFKEAVVPRSGTVMLDYPLVPVATGEKASAAVEAARLVGDRLASPEATRRLQAAGFRTASGDPTDAEGEVGVVEPDAVAEMLNTWVELTADARMLAVLDVSGSMQELAGARTRVMLARDAVLAALGDLPDEWQLGLWAFSRGLGEGSADHAELAPIRTLVESSGGMTHRAALIDPLRRLPGMTAGGTALHETALAAYRTAVDGYDPGRFNSVVLLTDGYNEDPDGISLPQLLDRLRSEQDPARPVQLITIGMGPQADTEALKRISEATGAPSYVVRDPRDIARVFDDALLQRVGKGLQ